MRRRTPEEGLASHFHSELLSSLGSPAAQGTTFPLGPPWKHLSREPRATSGCKVWTRRGRKEFLPGAASRLDPCRTLVQKHPAGRGPLPPPCSSATQGQGSILGAFKLQKAHCYILKESFPPWRGGPPLQMGYNIIRGVVGLKRLGGLLVQAHPPPRGHQGVGRCLKRQCGRRITLHLTASSHLPFLFGMGKSSACCPQVE